MTLDLMRAPDLSVFAPPLQRLILCGGGLPAAYGPLSVEDWRKQWALDCRVLSVSARLLRVCFMVPADQRAMIPFSRRQVDALLFGGPFGPWTDRDAAHIAALTLSLAPQIAALGGPRG